MNANNSATTLLTLLPRLQHQAVRDLCWTLCPQTDLLLTLAPFQRFGLAAQEHCVCDWLARLDTTPELLENYLLEHQRSPRLGIYFETLLRFYFQHCPHEPVQLIGHNIPIYEFSESGKGTEKRTLGELDFLLQHEGQRLHLEVAVKFYLAHPDGNDRGNQTDYLGPNAKDRWRNKIQHLKEHQLTLGQQVHQHCFWVKGCLFSYWKGPPISEQNVSTTAVKNRWLHKSELAAFIESSPDQWRILNKPDWLSGDSRQSEPNALLVQAALCTTRPVMLLNQHNNVFDRLMVVPDAWPNL